MSVSDNESLELWETRSARVRALAAVMMFSNKELDMFRNRANAAPDYMAQAALVIDELDNYPVPLRRK